MTWIFDRTGGHVALDFANTVIGRLTVPIERLPTYADLVELGRQFELVDAAQAKRLLREATAHPAEAEVARREAVSLREGLHGVLAARAAGAPPPPEALAAVNALVPRLRLGDDLRWTWQPGPHGLDAVLGPILEAALELLTTGARERVSRCELDTCGFFFLDTSKNHSRRWCDMTQCGNVAKARRYQERHRRRA
jgi:predicted RNA-binding Zn ribbon-like protein